MAAKAGDMTGRSSNGDGRLVERTTEGDEQRDADHDQDDVVEQISTEARPVPGQMRSRPPPLRTPVVAVRTESRWGPLRSGPPTVDSGGTLWILIPTLWGRLWWGWRGCVVRNLSVGPVLHDADATNNDCGSP